MMIALFFLGIVIVVVALVLLVKGLRGFAIAGRVIRRPTTAIGKLQEGNVEVAGRVTVIGEPVFSVSGHRCAAVKTTVRGRNGIGKGSSPTGEMTTTRVAEARVVDPTGQCRVDLASAEIVGEHWKSATVFAAALSELRWAYQLVPDNSTHIEVEEYIVEEGAKVLVSGDATLPEAKPGEGGYRDVAREWVVAGSANGLLVLSVGGQLRLIARSVVPATLVVLSSVYLAAFGVLLLAIVVGG